LLGVGVWLDGWGRVRLGVRLGVWLGGVAGLSAGVGGRGWWAVLWSWRVFWREVAGSRRGCLYLVSGETVLSVWVVVVWCYGR
jgi:hypothetical protein